MSEEGREGGVGVAPAVAPGEVVFRLRQLHIVDVPVFV